MIYDVDQLLSATLTLARYVICVNRDLEETWQSIEAGHFPDYVMRAKSWYLDHFFCLLVHSSIGFNLPGQAGRKSRSLITGREN